MSGSLLAAAAKPTFARHETFHPRFGWLRKAVTEASADPAVFTRSDATVRLGVGKNMVSAIRYWGLAYKILRELPNPDRARVPLLGPTEFGQALLGDDGWDPYLEDAGSLWLLHWKLLSPPCLTPAWWVAFNDFAPWQFSEPQLVAHVVELAAAAGWPSVVEASVKKDVDCMLRTYTARRQGRQGLDDLLDCPFRELGLLELAAGEGKQWRFVVGEKPNLPDPLIAYACLDFAARVADGAASITIARLASDPDGPGCAFRLSELALFAALQRAAPALTALEVAEPAGLRQLLFAGDPNELAMEALRSHYLRAADLQDTPI